MQITSKTSYPARAAAPDANHNETKEKAHLTNRDFSAKGDFRSLYGASCDFFLAEAIWYLFGRELLGQFVLIFIKLGQINQRDRQNKK